MITKMCSAVRCFLSDLLFEKIFGWRNAGEVAQEIERNVAKWNRTMRTGAQCYACHASDLVRDMSGSDGLFTSVHQFYRCRKCGNAQDDDGDTYQYESTALEYSRIVDDSGRYRYIFLRSGWWGLIFAFSVFWAIFGSVILIISYEFSYLQGLAIGLAPFILFILGALAL